MSYKVIKTDDIVFSNVNKASQYVPITHYAFNIPVTKGLVESLGLFFGTTGAVKGSITIDMYIDKHHRKYTLTPDQIVTNDPIVLTIDHTFKFEGMISVLIEFHKETEEGSFDIKVCDSGPCLYLESKSTSVFEFTDPPLISIITPIYKTDIKYLKSTMESVIEQTYEKWEWCIVDDGSGDQELREYLGSIQSDKVRFVYNETNEGIVGATNKALKLATGDFVGFLDHDDLLDKDALLYVALKVQECPDADLIYTDEDKVLEDGSYVGPFYKPDWNYSLLLSSMYTCHFSVYRKSIIDRIGGVLGNFVREGFDGSQDYDLALRFIEQTTHIYHVPRILYHWRVTESSTSRSITNKPDARFNGSQALSDHLERIGRKAMVVAGYYPGHYDVRYILSDKPKISVIIPFKDQVGLLNNLLHTFKLTSYSNYEIVLVDNNSEEEATHNYLEKLSSNKNIRILKYEKKFNFSKINNYAVSECDSEFILFLNNDVEIMHPHWMYNMVQHFVRPEVSVVGAKLLYLDHRIQHAGVIVGVNGIAGHSHKMMFDWIPGYFSRPHLTQDITAVTGACMMVRKKDFTGVRGFDEKLPTAFNDIDFCLKIRKKGKIIVYTPFARLYHRESYSRGLDSMLNSEFLKYVSYMSDKWDLAKFKDPYYNPNLPDNCEGKPWI